MLEHCVLSVLAFKGVNVFRVAASNEDADAFGDGGVQHLVEVIYIQAYLVEILAFALHLHDDGDVDLAEDVVRSRAGAHRDVKHHILWIHHILDLGLAKRFRQGVATYER